MPTDTEAPPHPAESALCTSCGLCCDNAMFGRVIVEADEAHRLRSLGVTVIEYDDGELSFNQPCPRLNCGTCEIYAHRPHTCSSYICEMLKTLRTGAIDEDEAASRIAQVKAARAAVDRQAGGTDPFEYRNAITDALEAGADPASLPGCTPELVRLETLLNRWFRTEDYAKAVPRA